MKIRLEIIIKDNFYNPKVLLFIKKKKEQLLAKITRFSMAMTKAYLFLVLLSFFEITSLFHAF